VLEQSVDPSLERVLQTHLKDLEGPARSQAIASLERSRQWRVLIPIIVSEQRRALVMFSLALLVGLILLSLWILKRLTQPLRNLAVAVQMIGRGERAQISHTAGGALGTVENAVLSLQEELVELRDQARVQGMESAWRDIARVMAHEIKNPLTPIRLTLDRMEERAATGEHTTAESLGRFVGRINTQVDTLERLVNQFRSFSREPDAEMRPLELAKAIRGVAESLGGQLPTEIEGDALILADPYLLDQVLLNLWKNALEAGADTMRVSIESTKQRILVAIHDNGPGIDKNKIEQVWLPYVTFKKKGTGLGLPVVKKMVETMGGSVSLQSQTGAESHGLTVLLKFSPGEKGGAGHE
jgi:signal transduction histidine kinase